MIAKGSIPRPTNAIRAHEFRPTTWRPWLGHHALAVSVLEDFTTDENPNVGRLTRNDLVELSRKCDTGGEASLVRLFVATMLWGSGTSNGRGPRYTADALEDPRLLTSLTETRHMILSCEPGRAYGSFRSRGVGPPFYTKWFWAAGLDRGLELTPLILDARVWASLGTLGWDSRVAAGSRWWADRYPAYLTCMKQWARGVPHVANAEQLEQMLFQWAGNRTAEPT